MSETAIRNPQKETITVDRTFKFALDSNRTALIDTHLLVMWFSAFELPLAKADSTLDLARDLTVISPSIMRRCRFSKSCVLSESSYRVRREKALVHSGGKPARELVRSTW